MNKPNIAILGATGVVGREITQIVNELGIEFNNIKFLSSPKSAGTKLNFQGKEYTVEETTPDSFNDVDIVLASAGGSTSQKYAPEIVKRGGMIIDNSSAFRMEKDVPLVIAGVNDEDLKWHKGIVANPNCSTSQLMLVLEPLKKFGFKKIVVSTYQSVSGAGLAAINELRAEMKTAVGELRTEIKTETGNLIENSFVILQFGQVVGTTVVKKVEVYEVLGSSARGGTTAIDAVKAADAAAGKLCSIFKKLIESL